MRCGVNIQSVFFVIGTREMLCDSKESAITVTSIFRGSDELHYEPECQRLSLSLHICMSRLNLVIVMTFACLDSMLSRPLLRSALISGYIRRPPYSKGLPCSVMANEMLNLYTSEISGSSGRSQSPTVHLRSCSARR